MQLTSATACEPFDGRFPTFDRSARLYYSNDWFLVARAVGEEVEVLSSDGVDVALGKHEAIIVPYRDDWATCTDGSQAGLVAARFFRPSEDTSEPFQPICGDPFPVYAPKPAIKLILTLSSSTAATG